LRRFFLDETPYGGEPLGRTAQQEFPSLGKKRECSCRGKLAPLKSGTRIKRWNGSKTEMGSRFKKATGKTLRNVWQQKRKGRIRTKPQGSFSLPKTPADDSVAGIAGVGLSLHGAGMEAGLERLKNSTRRKVSWGGANLTKP